MSVTLSKLNNLRSKQKGNFSVEFAIVGLFFSLLIVFSGDVIIKLSIKGKLDRLSYSLVNVLKERTQLYSEDYQITPNEARGMMTIGGNSLSRTLSTYDPTKFGALVEELTFRGISAPNPQKEYRFGGITCNVSKPLSELQHLSVITSWERQASLYRVTFCYETDNWIGDLLGTEFTRVSSSSVMIGR
ncbi:ATP-binding protein [Vibrionales bacterium C3R12]|nr:ATP-binding protein [Vibrionales bacterium C3R12]